MDLSTENEDSYTHLTKNSPTTLSPKRDTKFYVLNDKDRDEVKDLCIKYVPFWNKLNRNDIKVDLVHYAITNRVFVASLVNSDKTLFQFHKVVLKKIMPSSSIFYDPALQYQVSKLLGENSIGPKILAHTGEYTIQQWIEGVSITNDSYRNLSVITSIASALAKFHKRCTEIAPKEWDRTPFVISMINKWSKLVEPLFKKYDMGVQYSELMNCFEIYKKVIDNHVNTSKSVANSVYFCHNDAFCKNILNLPYGFCLIDYDYSGFNYVGWEIGNFFSHLFIVYSEQPPYFTIDDSLCLNNEVKNIFASVYLSCLLDKNVMPSDELVKDFLNSVEVHLLGVHVFWPFWRLLTLNRPQNELCIHVECYTHFKYHYDKFNEQLKKLRDEKLIEY